MKKALSFAVVAVMAVSQATAALAVGPASLSRVPPNRSLIVEKRPVVAPFAHILFCARNPSECRDNKGPSVIDLTPDRLNELTSVNRKVNRAIRGVNDRPGQMGGDVWQVNVRSGDCEDFALTKRSQLLARGWSSRALRIATAHTPSGEGHAVLVVKTNRGDYVLDNRTGKVKSVEKTDLRFEMIQSEADPHLWYSL